MCQHILNNTLDFRTPTKYILNTNDKSYINAAYEKRPIIFNDYQMTIIHLRVWEADM